MAIFVVYASIQLASSVTDEVIAMVDHAAEALDAVDDPCVWRHKADPNVVQLSVSVEAGNVGAALAAGRALAADAAQLLHPEGMVTEVIAYTDDGALRWPPPSPK